MTRQRILFFVNDSLLRKQTFLFLLVFVTGIIILFLQSIAVEKQQEELTLSSSFTHHNNSKQLELPLNVREVAFQLALDRANSRKSSTGQDFYSNLQEFYNATTPTTTTMHHVLNLIRVPKAGSSALSVTARALAGCQPDGYPCCRSPRIWRQCPRLDLFCDVIQGCIDHRPNYQEEQEEGYPSLTMIREPASRLVSAFFYAAPHRPKVGRNYSWELFETIYIPGNQWRNILTKMLNGYFAYDETFNMTSQESVTIAKARLCNITSFGFSNSPLGLALLLYETQPFHQLQPHPTVFELPPDYYNTTKGSYNNSSNNSSYEHGGGALRVQKNPEYEEFKETTYIQNHGKALVQKYNREDIEVYKFGKQLYCARVQEAGLLSATEKVGLLGLYKECLIFMNSDNTKVKKISTFTSSKDLCEKFSR